MALFLKCVYDPYTPKMFRLSLPGPALQTHRSQLSLCTSQPKLPVVDPCLLCSQGHLIIRLGYILFFFKKKKRPLRHCSCTPGHFIIVTLHVFTFSTLFHGQVTKLKMCLMVFVDYSHTHPHTCIGTETYRRQWEAWKHYCSVLEIKAQIKSYPQNILP